MGSGFQEILLIGLIIVGILVLPRMIKPPPPAPKPADCRTGSRLSWQFRLAIILSVLWPAGWTLYLKPWHPPYRVFFVIVGLGPIIIGWSIKWILAGMRNKR